MTAPANPVERLAKPLDNDRREGASVVTAIHDRPVYGTPTLRHLAVRAHLQLVGAREQALAARAAVDEVVRVASMLGGRTYRGVSGKDVQGLAERVAADLLVFPGDDERHLLVAAEDSRELVERLGGWRAC